MQWINRALVQATRKTAPPNGYCRKEECLSFLTMLDLRVDSVEKKPNYFEFSVIKSASAITTYGGSSFSNEVGTCYCLQIRHLIVNGVFKRTILQALNFRTDNNNSGTSHLMSMLFQ